MIFVGKLRFDVCFFYNFKFLVQMEILKQEQNCYWIKWFKIRHTKYWWRNCESSKNKYTNKKYRQLIEDY